MDRTDPADRFLRLVGALALACAFQVAAVVAMEATGHTGPLWYLATGAASLVLVLRLGFAR